MTVSLTKVELTLQTSHGSPLVDSSVKYRRKDSQTQSGTDNIKVKSSKSDYEKEFLPKS